MIKRRQQFKIESIEELIEAYKNLPFLYPLEEEIEDFKCEGMRYIKFVGGKFILDHYNKNRKVVPNPFEKSSQLKLKGIEKAMDDLSNEAKKLGFEVEVVFKNI